MSSEEKRQKVRAHYERAYRLKLDHLSDAQVDELYKKMELLARELDAHLVFRPESSSRLKLKSSHDILKSFDTHKNGSH